MIYKVVFFDGRTGIGESTVYALEKALGQKAYHNYLLSVTRPMYWGEYITKTLPGKQNIRGKVRTTQNKKNMYEVCGVYRNKAKTDLIYTVYRAEFRETLELLDSTEKPRIRKGIKKSDGKISKSSEEND